MRKNTAFRIAASALVIGASTVGCAPAAQHPASFSAHAPKEEKAAAKLFARSQRMIQKGRLAEALTLAEQVVALAPRDVGYRMVLGDLYLKNGRFLSAEQAFADVLTLNPGNPRASLSVALAQIGQGRNAQALTQLDQLALTAAPADLGLAYALAGQPQRAIAMLEPAARAPGADGRVRQNLALAYALAGDWQKARVFAAQDVSPADLGARLEQWAAFAQPQAHYTQVATLLGVKNVYADSGQPAHLALAPEPTEVAMSAPVVEAPAEAPAPTPVAVVLAEVPPPVTAGQILLDAIRVEAPQPAATETRYAEAVETIMRPEPAVIHATLPPAPLPAFKPAQQRTTFAPLRPKKRSGHFVVQIGAFKTQLQTERAWIEAQKRYSIADREPLSTTVSIAGKGTFHRLSVSGFDNAAEAGRLCRSIKARGGACFVRTSAGDIPVQWASRHARPRG